ncbi:MAG: DUF2293 domain-containing protein [Lentisphaeria bacterium]|nr:DUF2293 domain-containing protein [Lentisphaeria bacterium]
MNQKEIQVWKAPGGESLLCEGKTLLPPPGWIFVPSGDPALTRRLKATGEYWVQVHRRKNRIESQGIWTDGRRVPGIRARLEAEHSSAAYQQKLAAARQARIKKQDEYVVQFRQAVVNFLNFAPRYHDLAWELADAVTDQAIPVGSGTVARTERIPLPVRAEAAVIAWMRHQTTAYDQMSIARIRGERREVRRRLAERSRILLSRYRNGEEVDPETCPLARALK